MSQKDTLFILPLMEAVNHKPKLVSYSQMSSIYEDDLVPAIYGILCQSDPTHYHFNVSFSYPKPIQNSFPKCFFNLPHSKPC